MSAVTPSFVRPNVHEGAHPIETTRYLLATPSILEFRNTLRTWIINRAPGGMIYGPPRYGKTRAILYLCRVLADDLGSEIPMLQMLCRDKLPSESVFFGDLLKDAGHELHEKGTGSVKRNRLIEYLIELVELSKQSRIIIFLDEAQRLHERHYNWLIDVYNELDAREVTPIFLLVGQPELIHQFNTFQKSKKMQIIGRFMVHRLRFHGLRNSRDIKTCLEGYDTGSEYPEDSGVSYTQYFYPAAFKSGFRLAAYAEELWDAFRRFKEESQLDGPREIPMQYFCRSVEYQMKNFGSLEDTAPRVSLAQWKKAIGASGYADAERYVLSNYQEPSET